MVKIARRSNDNMTLVSETSHKQNHCGNHKAALNEKLTDSPQWFFICNSVFNLIGWDKNKMKQNWGAFYCEKLIKLLITWAICTSVFKFNRDS